VDEGPGLIAPWSQDKLALLRKYLAAYSTIMQPQKKRWLKAYSYIDAFSNEGLYVHALQGDAVPGSPLVALDCEPPFDKYWFIEVSARRMQRLQERTQQHQLGRRIQYRTDDANEVLVHEIAQEITFQRFQRGFVFLDPYGLNVVWETLAALASTRALDVFVNFPIMGINRVLPRDIAPSEDTSRLIELVMGSAAWLDQKYQSQIDLFGEERVSRGRLDAMELAALYAERARTLFDHVSRPVVMGNSQNAPLYALFLLSHNPTTVKITNDIFGSFERLKLNP
jgi:three-Cys-motif partner protein